jgi:hypothetical protein
MAGNVSSSSTAMRAPHTAAELCHARRGAQEIGEGPAHLKRDAVEQLIGAHHAGRAVGSIGKVPRLLPVGLKAVHR